MSRRHIWTVYRKELTDSLRDHRTVISTVVIPTLLIPLLMLVTTRIAAQTIAKARQDVPTVMLLGGEDSPTVTAALQRQPGLKVVPATADWRTQIADKKVRVAVEIPPGFAVGLQQGHAADVVLYNYQGEMNSTFAMGQVDQFFQQLRNDTITARLTERGLPATLARPFMTQRQNVAPPEKVGGNLVGGILPYLLMILCVTGAVVPALDLAAGEKERGTMETLLCSPVSRVDVVLGKFLMVLTGSMTAALLSMTSLAVTGYFGLGMLGLAGSKGLTGEANQLTLPAHFIDPWGLAGVILLTVPVAVLFSAATLAVSVFAKSYKEGQTYVTPLILLVILPAMLGTLPGVELSSKMALVPVLGVSLACKEMLSGVWNWLELALIFVSTAAYAALALWAAVRMFHKESVLFRV